MPHSLLNSTEGFATFSNSMSSVCILLDVVLYHLDGQTIENSHLPVVVFLQAVQGVVVT